MSNEDKEFSRVIDMIVRKVYPKKIILFGSRAMDRADENSDYDLFIVTDSIGSPRSIEKELYYLMAKEGVGIPVDLRVETQATFDQHKSNRYMVYHQVDQYGKTIYERESASPAVA